jgi:hypothetical protein
MMRYASHPGAVEEYRAWTCPWGFAPEEVTVPVGGTRNELVNSTWPHRRAPRIPNASLDIRDGYVMAYRHYGEIFEALTR